MAHFAHFSVYSILQLSHTPVAKHDLYDVRPTHFHASYSDKQGHKCCIIDLMPIISDYYSIIGGFTFSFHMYASISLPGY